MTCRLPLAARGRWTALLAAGWVLAGATSQARQHPSSQAVNPGGTIAGVVVDQQTGRPVPWAVVSIEVLGVKAGANEAGEFQLLGLLPGTYAVVCETPGYTRAVTSGVGVEPGKTVRLHFVLVSTPLRHEEVVDVVALLPRRDEDRPVGGVTLSGRSLTATAGARLDYSSAGRRTHVSPRVSASFRLRDGLQLNGAAGVTYQPLPSEFLAVHPEFLRLRDMRARHYALEMRVSGRQGWRLTLEAYAKQYSALPIDPGYPHRLTLDKEPFRSYTHPQALTDRGTGSSRGVELSIERRIAERFLGMVMARVSRDRFRDSPISVSLSSVVFSFGFSLLVGTFFGVYPASRAARLEPSDAVRSE